MSVLDEMEPVVIFIIVLDEMEPVAILTIVCFGRNGASSKLHHCLFWTKWGQEQSSPLSVLDEMDLVSSFIIVCFERNGANCVLDETDASSQPYKHCNFFVIFFQATLMKLPKDDVERIIMDFPECRDTILNSSELICNKAVNVRRKKLL